MEPDGIPTNSNGFHRIPTDPNGFHRRKYAKVGKCWKKSEIYDPTFYDPTLAFSEFSLLLKNAVHWPASELNTQVNLTTCLGDTGCWIQQVTAPTLVVTCWIHLCTCI